MSRHLRRIEPDQILYSVEGALDKLTDLITAISKQDRPKPRMYRDILRRRLSLSSFSRQIRANERARDN